MVVVAYALHTWSLLNRFQSGQGLCCANLCKWGLTQSSSCDYGQCQAMNHIVDTWLNLVHDYYYYYTVFNASCVVRLNDEIGEWLDILWCSVCLSLTFVTFFVKKYLLAHINSNKVYFKFVLFLSIAALRVCVEDRHSFTESRRACTGDSRDWI